MIQTKQAVERYRTLQHELIESLGTEQLLKLQQDCIEVAHKGHLLESNRLFKWAVIGALCFILMMFFPAVKVTLVVVLLIGFFGHEFSNDYRYDLAFSLADGETFIFYQWSMSPDNPSKLMLWQEARAGYRGPIEVVPVLVPKLQCFLKLLEPMSFTSYLGMPLLFGFFVLMVTTLPIIILAAGLYFTFEFLKYRWAKVPQIDPNKSSFSDAYRTITQVLDIRVAAASNRRPR